LLGPPSTMEFKTDLTLNMYGSAERRRDAQQEQFRKTDPKGAVIEWFPMYNDRTQMNAAGRAMAGLSANDNRAAGKGEVNWGDPLAHVQTRWQMKYVGGDRAAGHGATRNPFAWPEGNTPEEAQRLRQVLQRDKLARAAPDPWAQLKLQGKQHGMEWEPEAVSGSLLGADQKFVDTYGGDG